MSAQISCKTDCIEYIVNNSDDESFTAGYLKLESEKSYQEDGGDYKAPKDDVVTQIYSAESDHGDFRWEVTSRRSGFDSFAEIEEVRLIEAPENCDPLDTPRFTIEELD